MQILLLTFVLLVFSAAPYAAAEVIKTAEAPFNGLCFTPGQRVLFDPSEWFKKFSEANPYIFASSTFSHLSIGYSFGEPPYRLSDFDKIPRIAERWPFAGADQTIEFTAPSQLSEDFRIVFTKIAKDGGIMGSGTYGRNAIRRECAKADFSPPTVPENRPIEAGDLAVVLEWRPSQDNYDLPSRLTYKIWRDGKLIGNVTGATQFTDNTVDLFTQYPYQISAVDSSGNESALSEAYSFSRRMDERRHMTWASGNRRYTLNKINGRIWDGVEKRCVDDFGKPLTASGAVSKNTCLGVIEKISKIDNYWSEYNDNWTGAKFQYPSSWTFLRHMGGASVNGLYVWAKPAASEQAYGLYINFEIYEPENRDWRAKMNELYAQIKNGVALNYPNITTPPLEEVGLSNGKTVFKRAALSIPLKTGGTAEYWDDYFIPVNDGGFLANIMINGAPSVKQRYATEIQKFLDTFTVDYNTLGVSLSPLPTLSATGLSFTKTLRRGSSDEEVRRLQTFLAKWPDIYPEGLVTGYFGALTEEAVRKFQKKNGIISSGAANTTGYGLVGPKTRAALNQLIVK